MRFARFNGLNVGIQESKEAVLAADSGLLEDKTQFRYGLKSLFCCEPDEGELFDQLYEQFWGNERGQLSGTTTYQNQSNIQKKAPASLVMMGSGKTEPNEEGEEARNVSGANETERIRKTDFSKLNAIDSQMLEELALKLFQQMSKRIKRKMKNSTKQGRVDLRQTIRNSLSHGGDPIELHRRKQVPKKQRLIILLDVSGSMDKYSFFLLRFIWSLRAHFETVEAFIFSTSLIRITDYLDAKDLEWTLTVLSMKANNWSSGTQIGDCFRTFNEQYAKQVLTGRSTTIILSDGLDTGEPEDLATELNKIKRRTRKLIWLNPLKGMQGYEPIQRGMAAALPELDVFQSAHNLNSLLELERYLEEV